MNIEDIKDYAFKIVSEFACDVTVVAAIWLMFLIAVNFLFTSYPLFGAVIADYAIFFVSSLIVNVAIKYGFKECLSNIRSFLFSTN